MKNQSLKRWEAALIAGLVIGMLATPAQAEGMVLSRWPVEEYPPQYQVTLFPFGVAQIEAETLTAPERRETPEYEVKFKLVEWWKTLTAPKTP